MSRPSSRAALVPTLLALSLMPTESLLSRELRYTRFQLENGLTVILHQDRRLPLVAVNLWYHVGSKDEPAGRSGFAHLFEHLMFMGTEAVPYPGFDSIMESSGGSNNASTSTDRTNYFESGPSHLLETFLYLEADRMAALGKSMDQEKLDTQRGVVRNERRQSYENRPYGKAFLEIPRLLYPPDHPYHHPVIGSHTDLEAATVEDVKDFFEDFYDPGNATLAIAGDIDPPRARDLVEKHFGRISRGPAPPRKPSLTPPRLQGTVRHQVEDTVELPLSVFVWHSPAVYAEGDAELDVLATVLAGGKSSRLYESLVYDKKTAQEVAAYQASRLLGSELRILVHARPGSSQDEIEAEVDRQVERLRAEGPTQREIDRARNRIETTFWQGLQSVSERADLLNTYQFHFGDPGAIGRDRARYDAVTPETVRRWAREVLDPGSRLILRVVPRKE